MSETERPIRFRDMRPREPRLQGAAKCRLCEAAGKIRIQKTHVSRVAHLEDYHGLCRGCEFKHPQHGGRPCDACNCGHPAEAV